MYLKCDHACIFSYDQISVNLHSGEIKDLMKILIVGVSIYIYKVT